MSRAPPYNPNFFNAAAASPTSNRMAPPYQQQQQRQLASTAPSAASSTASLLPSRAPAQAAPFPSNFPKSSSTSIKSVASNVSLNTNAYSSKGGHSLSDKFSLSPDPSVWVVHNQQEPDDYIHNPDPRRDHKNDRGGTVFTARGIANLGCLVILVVGLTTLFAGYPMITYFTRKPLSTLGAFNLGGTNASGQVPVISNNWALIDVETPLEAYTKTATDGTELDLVFSDEFNTPGRTFYPGDDPYWEAVDLHYWATNNLEWYDPGQLTTENGYLKITLTDQPSHGLNYTGGLMSSWNKFCFTGGRVEVAVQLPGSPKVMGLWPALWAMGNLGRAGYGASLDGMWPYTYDSCDVGVLPNQTTADHRPIAATVGGDKQYGDVLSYLPGQRLSACTCLGESHPGPLLPNQRLRGRAAPELDILEAQVDGDKGIGEVSQSGQWAPFDASYIWDNSSANLQINDPQITFQNPYMGGVYQQATSGVSKTDQACYTMSPEALAGSDCFSVYGFEYLPDRQKGYITWINNNQSAWTLNAAGMGPNDKVGIGQRLVPEEPMYLIMNLGISKNFGFVDFANLVFPVDMRVDWIRVYQPKGSKNIGCDPPDYPTQEYINAYIEAYTNPNLTTWVDDYKQTLPKNSILDGCPNGPAAPDLSGLV